MRLIFLLPTFFLTVELFAQSKDTFLPAGQIKTGTIPCEVSVDTSMQYKLKLIDFSFSGFDSIQYFSQLGKLSPMGNFEDALGSFPRKWIALSQLKGNYYLYYPSDFGYHYQFEITDSTTIDFTTEGAEPGRLDSLTFESPYQLKIYRTNHWKDTQVTIRFVDTAKGIAVFTFGPTMYNTHAAHELMVDAAKVHLFPVIVNHSEYNRQPEVEFDSVDFESLLK